MDKPTLTEVKAQAWDRLMASTRAQTDDALMEAWSWYQRASENTAEPFGDLEG